MAAATPRAAIPKNAFSVLLSTASDHLGVAPFEIEKTGIFVEDFNADGLAAKAGVEVGDRIWGVAGISTKTVSSMVKQMRAHPAPVEIHFVHFDESTSNSWRKKQQAV